MAKQKQELSLLLLLCVCVHTERAGIKDVTVIHRLHEVIEAALCHQLVKSYPPTSVAEVRSRISDRLATAQLISTHHSELLARFKSMHPDADFPALHKELFSQEGIDAVLCTQP